MLDCDLNAFTRYYKKMVEQGIILAPSQFEGIFIGYKHSEEDLKKTLDAMEYALKNCFE